MNQMNTLPAVFFGECTAHVRVPSEYVRWQLQTMINRCIYRLYTTGRTTTTKCQFQLNYRCTYNRRIRNASAVRNESEECAPCTTSALATTLGTIQLDFRFFVRANAERERVRVHRTKRQNRQNENEFRFSFSHRCATERFSIRALNNKLHICNKIKGRSARAPVHSHPPIAQFNSRRPLCKLPHMCLCLGSLAIARIVLCIENKECGK